MSSLVNENLFETMQSLGLFTLDKKALCDGIEVVMTVGSIISSIERRLDTSGGLIRVSNNDSGNGDAGQLNQLRTRSKKPRG